MLNERIIEQLFSLSGVEVISATIEIENVRAHRTKNNMHAASTWCYHHQYTRRAEGSRNLTDPRCEGRMRTPSGTTRHMAARVVRASAKDRAGNAGKRVVEIATVPEHGGLDKLKLVLACWQRKSNSRGFAQTLNMTHSGWNNEKSPIYSKVTKRPLNENSLAYGITDRGSPTIHTRSWTWFWPR